MCLNPHHAPIGSPRRKAQIHQPSGGTHLPDLGTSEAPLQRCAEAIACVGAEGVEAAVAVVAEGEGGHGHAGGFCQGCEAGEGPVDGEGDQVGNELLWAVAARTDVTFWRRFIPPLPRLLGGLFAGLLMVH